LVVFDGGVTMTLMLNQAPTGATSAPPQAKAAGQ
jgi:hypothetical protein